MATMQFSTTINSSPVAIFNLIADLQNYGRWLSPSTLYVRTTSISDDPIKVGTIYRDRSRGAEMYGEVTRFEPPTAITFEQVLQRRLLGLVRVSLHITIRYTLRQIEQGTRVVRETTVQPGGVAARCLSCFCRPSVARTNGLCGR